MDMEAWHAAIHGVSKSRTRPSDWTELNWRVAIHHDAYSDITDHMETWRPEPLESISFYFKSYFQKTVTQNKDLTLSVAQSLFLYHSMRHEFWSRLDQNDWSINDCSKLILLILYSKCFCEDTKNKQKAVWIASVSRNCQFYISVSTEVSKRKNNWLIPKTDLMFSIFLPISLKKVQQWILKFLWWKYNFWNTISWLMQYSY